MRHCMRGSLHLSIACGQETKKLRFRSTSRCHTAFSIWARWKALSISTRGIAWVFSRSLTLRCAIYTLRFARIRRGLSDGSDKSSTRETLTGRERRYSRSSTRTFFKIVEIRKNWSQTCSKAKLSHVSIRIAAISRDDLPLAYYTEWVRCCAKYVGSRFICRRLING